MDVRHPRAGARHHAQVESLRGELEIDPRRRDVRGDVIEDAIEPVDGHADRPVHAVRVAPSGQVRPR
jgi:hypothetical protein